MSGKPPRTCYNCGLALIPPFIGNSCTFKHIGGYGRLPRNIKIEKPKEK